MKITLLEPAMCCSTGLCGEVVDDELLQTAANLQWLKSLGHDVSRHNISNDASAFKLYPQAVVKLQSEGLDSLPYILINDRMVMSGVYPTKSQWEKFVQTDVKTPQTNIKSESTNCCSGSSCC